MAAERSVPGTGVGVSGFNHICPRCGYVNHQANENTLSPSHRMECESCGIHWKVLSASADGRNVDELDIRLKAENSFPLEYEYNPPLFDKDNGKGVETRRSAVSAELFQEDRKIRRFSSVSDDMATLSGIEKNNGLVPKYIGGLFVLLLALVAAPQLTLHLVSRDEQIVQSHNIDPMTTASVSKEPIEKASNSVNFTDVSLIRIIRGNTHYVLVRGKAHNTGFRNLHDAKLKLTLYDKKNDIVGDWTDELDVEEFISGKIVQFKSETKIDGTNAARVVVSYEPAK